jgi:hypothetical protein
LGVPAAVVVVAGFGAVVVVTDVGAEVVVAGLLVVVEGAVVVVVDELQATRKSIATMTAANRINKPFFTVHPPV